MFIWTFFKFFMFKTKGNSCIFFFKKKMSMKETHIFHNLIPFYKGSSLVSKKPNPQNEVKRKTLAQKKNNNNNKGKH